MEMSVVPRSTRPGLRGGPENGAHRPAPQNTRSPHDLAKSSLQLQFSESLRERIIAGDWNVGDQLPSEDSLAREYGISRGTVRAGIQRLSTLGLVVAKHGRGTFVSPFSNAIQAGLQHLRSMTQIIAAHGAVPEMRYYRVAFRAATADERLFFRRDEDFVVLDVAREVLADGVVVAFSYEVIPRDFLPEGVGEEDVSGSLFELLDRAGNLPVAAIAELHAATGPDIGWGDRDPAQLYVLLLQTHVDDHANPITQSRTYFYEGRFQFTILRS